MGTSVRGSSSAYTLFGKTRCAVLALLYTHPDQAFHTREIIRMAGAGLGAVQRELQRLTEASIVVRRAEGHQVYYQANRSSPIYEELRGLVVKTMGVADVLRAALAGLAGRIGVAFLYGSTARGADRADSDVDLLIVGDVSFAEVVAALRAAQEVLQREVNPAVYPPGEFRHKLADGHHFLTTVIREPKVFLIGDEHGLEDLASQRMGDPMSEPGRFLTRKPRR